MEREDPEFSPDRVTALLARFDGLEDRLERSDVGDRVGVARELVVDALELRSQRLSLRGASATVTGRDCGASVSHPVASIHALAMLFRQKASSHWVAMSHRSTYSLQPLFPRISIRIASRFTPSRIARALNRSAEVAGNVKRRPTWKSVAQQSSRARSCFTG